MSHAKQTKQDGQPVEKLHRKRYEKELARLCWPERIDAGVAVQRSEVKVPKRPAEDPLGVAIRRDGLVGSMVDGTSIPLGRTGMAPYGGGFCSVIRLGGLADGECGRRN